MLRLSLAVLLACIAVPVLADAEKAESCGFQAQVVSAIQQARLDNVKERNVEKTILASDPAWPANYSNAIPLITPWVYELPMKQVRDNDLSEIWNQNCLGQ
ncbi:hypothetical protein CEP88_18735 [Roseobacter denitrificans]|uniref:Uncharacterized protein n=1 Tax=Roseobacter denitrificans (strain ATCC 33942 / OCh 114) TaxID=375451 RepID=Q169D3_ROSDO|nr:hypothetical protein [Roseobacter denitrificans]ABG31410.1 hypothetical protein RD1_1792 [Roseobacter denitrificans OCh 114]AVL54427.1 hypothetical protein CEP88_18735 [Roseobacter denitrificans]SFG00836.1 hypothetical protein SAMN05443635_105229 [Roseobacter denitrificans OCh 114]